MSSSKHVNKDAVASFASHLSSVKPPLKTPKGRFFNDPRNGRNPVNPVRVAVFDIETTGLNASFGRVLCAAIQFYGPEELKVFRADQYPEWKKGLRSDDSKLVADILAALEPADIIIAHNGVNFDTAFLRTRALIHGLPPVHPKKIVDPVLIARKVFRFHSNSLESIAAMLGTDFKKTPVAPQYWITALADGNKESLDYIVTHCIKDIYVLEEIAKKIMPYAKQIDSIGSWR